MSTITALVIAVESRSTSANGNPTYDVTLSVATSGWPGTITLATKPDASINYGITNPEFFNEPHVFTLTKKNQIESAIPAGI